MLESLKKLIEAKPGAMNREVIKKLKIKPDYSILVLNSPEGYLTKSYKVDVKVSANVKYDFVMLFIKSKIDLEKTAPNAIKVLKDNGHFWVAYPKKSSGIKTNITRDHGWESLTAKGFEGVSLIAIDETWSALRFKPLDKKPAIKQSNKSTKRKSFDAILEKPDDGMDTAYISIPFDIEKTYGTKGQVKVKSWFDGYPYRGILANMGTACHILIVRKDVRKAIGKNVGDKVSVEIEQDMEERVVEIPNDLKSVLAKSPKAEKFFNSLSYTNRKEYSGWITSAKKTETREKRLSETIQKLIKGLKNPSQK